MSNDSSLSSIQDSETGAKHLESQNVSYVACNDRGQVPYGGQAHGERSGERDRLIVTLFCQEHLTMRQIGASLGISQAAICKRIKRLGIPRSAGERSYVNCSTCGKELSRVRFRVRRSRRAFCSRECYYGSRNGENFRQSRSGGRTARKVASRYFALQAEHVVHHFDSDQTNNSIDNLAVFASQSEHMAYHHGTPGVLPLWDGRELVLRVA